MIAFILDAIHHSDAQLTKGCLANLFPDWQIVFVETNPALTMNQMIHSYSEPFFMTLYAGETFTPSFARELEKSLRQMPDHCAGIALNQTRDNRVGSAIPRGPVLWRTEAAVSMPAGFATQEEFPFESYLLHEMQYRLRPSWEWMEVIADDGKSRLRSLPGWKQPHKEWECVLPVIAAQEPPRRDDVRPKVTVVISTYNDADYLHWAIRSVIVQSYPYWELIIVNDASVDHTITILQSISHPHIHVINNDVNCGKSICLNKALALAKADWLLELDADDWLTPDCIEKLLEYAEGTPGTGAVYADHTEWYERANKQLVYKQSVTSMPIFSVQTMLTGSAPLAPRLYRIQVLRSLGGWLITDPFQGRLYEDFQILLRISLRHPVIYAGLSLYHRRLRKDSITHLMSGNYRVWKSWIKQTLLGTGESEDML